MPEYYSTTPIKGESNNFLSAGITFQGSQAVAGICDHKGDFASVNSCKGNLDFARPGAMLSLIPTAIDNAINVATRPVNFDNLVSLVVSLPDRMDERNAREFIVEIKRIEPRVADAQIFVVSDFEVLMHCLSKGRLGLRNRNGNSVTTNGLFTILHNPFYMGLIRIQKTGDVFAGAHRPIVSKRLFDQVQAIFAGKNVPKHTIHNFTYRRMIRCSKCERLLIGELQKRMIYYRCQTRDCTSACLKEETVTETLSREMKRLELGPEEFRLYRNESIKLFDDWNNESKKVRDELVLRQKKIKDRRGKLVDSYLDGVLDKEEYVERKAQLIGEELELKDRIARLDKSWNGIPSKFEDFLELANSAYLSFVSAPVDLRREMLNIVTSNLTANGKSVSIKLENTFELLASRPSFPSGRARPYTARTVCAYLRKIFKTFIKNDKNEVWKTIRKPAQNDVEELRSLVGFLTPRV